MHRSPAPPILARNALALALAALAACTPARRELGPRLDAVRRIEFDGNGGALSGHNDLQLEQQMQTESSAFGLTTWPFLYWVDPEPFDPDLLLRDSYRLEVWYAHHGWFDARVTGWEIDRVRQRKPKRGGVVDLHGVVETGPRSLVTAYPIAGLDRPTFTLLKGTMRRQAYLHEGDPFELDSAEHDRALLASLLRNHGFAYATVDLEVDADPANQSVAVTLVGDPGISSKFGPITVENNVKVADGFILRAMSFEEGEPFDESLLTASQQRLFDMGTFSVVRVEPDRSDPEEPAVPVTVRVTESKWRTLRVGIGTTGQRVAEEGAITDGLAFSPRISTTFRHNNLGRQLIRFDITGSVGAYVDVGALDSGQAVEPTWSVASSATWPRIGGTIVSTGVSGSVERGVNLAGAWTFRRQQTEAHLGLDPTRHLRVTLGPHLERYEYLLENDLQLREARRLFGSNFQNPYDLVALDLRGVHDTRFGEEGARLTGRGHLLDGAIRRALPVTETAYDYWQLSVDLRGFKPIRVGGADRFPVRAAGGIKAQWQIPIGEQGVPYPERLFLGGASSIRGFRTGQVGPYTTLCDPDTGSETYQPVGGSFAVQPSLELRYPWLYGITWATFVDAAVLTESPADVGPDDLRFSGGAGFRYDTVIGPIRFDLSARPTYPEDEGPLTVTDCTGDSRTARRYDLISGLRPNADDHPPYALVFYLAIGEAL